MSEFLFDTIEMSADAGAPLRVIVRRADGYVNISALFAQRGRDFDVWYYRHRSTLAALAAETWLTDYVASPNAEFRGTYLHPAVVSLALADISFSLSLEVSWLLWAQLRGEEPPRLPSQRR